MAAIVAYLVDRDVVDDGLVINGDVRHRKIARPMPRSGAPVPPAGPRGYVSISFGSPPRPERPSIIERRRTDPAAMAPAEAKILERKSWHALGGFDPSERNRALDLLGYYQQLVFAGSSWTSTERKIAAL
jgi:hypothetical protein